MIKDLTIKNFQSHKASTLEFDKGVNIIVGPSDSGKTAIIRALRWLIWNRPSGDSIRSHWGGETEVSVEFDRTATPITKVKGKENYYLYDGLKFEAIRTEVPGELSFLMNVNEVNLQRQLDSPFLLSNTPGEVAQHFNKVARLDKIDSATQNVNSWIRELTSDIKHKEEQVETIQEQLKGFEYLEKFEIELEVLEELDKQRLNKVLSSNSLDKLIRNVQHISILIDNEKEKVQYEKDVNFLLELYKLRRDVKQDKESLWSLCSSINLTEDEINFVKQQLVMESQVDNLLSLYDNRNTLNLQLSKLNAVVSQISSITRSIETKVEETARKQAKFKDAMGEVCVLCGSKLK